MEVQEPEPEYDPWDETPGPEEATLERAWEALDEDDPEQALAELSSLDPDWPDRWIPEAIALTELGELPRARAALERVRSVADVDDHPDFLWAEGQLLLCEWRIDEAETALTRLVEIERSASALERLSLVADLRTDFAKADQLLQESLAIAQQSAAAERDDAGGSSDDADRDKDPMPTMPVRMTSDEFDGLLSEAIDELPEEFRRPLETTEILVEPVPAEWMIDRADPGETPPDVLGLFVGASELEVSGENTGVLPRRIFLFQRNLERFARSRDELVEEIRVTLFHEIGHMLGFDEAGVEAMGLE